MSPPVQQAGQVRLTVHARPLDPLPSLGRCRRPPTLVKVQTLLQGTRLNAFCLSLQVMYQCPRVSKRNCAVNCIDLSSSLTFFCAHILFDVSCRLVSIPWVCVCCWLVVHSLELMKAYAGNASDGTAASATAPPLGGPDGPLQPLVASNLALIFALESQLSDAALREQDLETQLQKAKRQAEALRKERDEMQTALQARYQDSLNVCTTRTSVCCVLSGSLFM
jgi:hypothetical protein